MKQLPPGSLGPSARWGHMAPRGCGRSPCPARPGSGRAWGQTLSRLTQHRPDLGTDLLLKRARFQLMEPTGWLHLDPAIWAQVRDWPPGVNDFWSLLVGGLVCADDKDERGFRQFRGGPETVLLYLSEHPGVNLSFVLLERNRSQIES